VERNEYYDTDICLISVELSEHELDTLFRRLQEEKRGHMHGFLVEKSWPFLQGSVVDPKDFFRIRIRIF
jgi:hypothetical protein